MFRVDVQHGVIVSWIADRIWRSGPSEIDGWGVRVEDRLGAAIMDPGRAALAERGQSPVRLVRD